MQSNSARGRARSFSRDIAYTALGTALIAVCAWISLPIAEVPFTLQTFAVCAVGGLLGWKRGTAALLAYLLMGLVGIPVFAGFKAGAAALMGPTGGYLLGFVVTVLLSGLAKGIPVKGKWGRAALFYAFMIMGTAVCYAFGTAWFLLVYNGGAATPMGLSAALMLCVVPYIVPDLVKLALAALLSVRLEGEIK